MSFDGEPAVLVYLTGSFKIELADGRDVTPRSSKAQGLIALLATSSSGARSRSWLQSHLWSDRAPEQASGSLRQCLVQLRHALADIPEVLEATRQKISLDLGKVSIVACENEEVLEGLDVRDEEFEGWLRTLHVRGLEVKPAAVTSKASERPQVPVGLKTISIQTKVAGEATNGQLEWLGQLLADNMSKQLRETFSVDVSVAGPASIDPNLWQVDIEMCQVSATTLGVRMSLSRPARNLHVWANHTTVEMRGAPPVDHPDLALLSNQIIEAIGDELFLKNGPDANCPDTLCRSAIRGMFTIEADRVNAADNMFARAFDLEPRGLYLAWRAQAKTIMKIERHDHDGKALLEEAEALCAKALEAEPNNSMVLATVADTYCLILREYDRSLFLADRSARLNPSNPMAWSALSTAHMLAGNSKQSLQFTLRVHRLALTSPHRFWWDSQVFAAALTAGKLEEADHFAESCRVQNPNYRPPLRYLIALHANAGRQDKALQMARDLTAIEPDFTIERLVEDRDYPAALLHQDTPINLGKIAELA